MFSLVVSEKSAIGLEMNSESQALWEREESRDVVPKKKELAPPPLDTNLDLLLYFFSKTSYNLFNKKR